MPVREPHGGRTPVRFLQYSYSASFTARLRRRFCSSSPAPSAPCKWNTDTGPPVNWSHQRPFWRETACSIRRSASPSSLKKMGAPP